jgi:hypothetical protein
MDPLHVTVDTLSVHVMSFCRARGIGTIARCITGVDDSASFEQSVRTDAGCPGDGSRVSWLWEKRPPKENGRRALIAVPVFIPP